MESVKNMLSLFVLLLGVLFHNPDELKSSVLALIIAFEAKRTERNVKFLTDTLSSPEEAKIVF